MQMGSNLTKKDDLMFTEQSKIEHLRMLQAIIERMARNSFFIKGWTITIVSAIFVLANNNNHPLIFIFALFPAGAFCWMDAFYLRLERQYRRLYEWTITLPEFARPLDEEDRKQLSTPYNLKLIKAIRNSSDKDLAMLSCLRSTSIKYFYASCALVVILLSILMILPLNAIDANFAKKNISITADTVNFNDSATPTF